MESSFTSIADMAKLQEQYALLPMQLSSQRFDSISKVGGLRLPALYIHGTADEIVPYSMGEQLYKASGGPKRFVPIGGGLHGNNAAVGGRVFRSAIRDFIEAPRLFPTE